MITIIDLTLFFFVINSHQNIFKVSEQRLVFVKSMQHKFCRFKLFLILKQNLSGKPQAIVSVNSTIHFDTKSLAVFGGKNKCLSRKRVGTYLPSTTISYIDYKKRPKLDIYVMDTGINKRHTEFAGINIERIYDPFRIGSGTQPLDESWNSCCWNYIW